MNVGHLAAGLLSCAISSPAIADGELTANLSLTSDYVWRGVSQTQGDPAVQGGVDYAHESGVYLGVWASNVDFFSNGAPGSVPEDDDQANIEIDWYIGYWAETEAGIGWDIGVVQYRYPGARKTLLDTSEEFYLGVNYEFFEIMVYRDFDNQSGYLEAGLEFELPGDLGLRLRGGHFDFDDARDYSDYQIALSRVIAGFDVSVRYTDTDLSARECENGYWFEDLCDGRFSAEVARHFSF